MDDDTTPIFSYSDLREFGIRIAQWMKEHPDQSDQAIEDYVNSEAGYEQANKLP